MFFILAYPVLLISVMRFTPMKHKKKKGRKGEVEDFFFTPRKALMESKDQVNKRETEREECLGGM